MLSMKIFTVTYDPEADAGYIGVAGPIMPGEVKRSGCVNDELVIDFDAEGRLIGIEALRKGPLHPATLSCPPAMSPATPTRDGRTYQLETYSVIPSRPATIVEMQGKRVTRIIASFEKGATMVEAQAMLRGLEEMPAGGG